MADTEDARSLNSARNDAGDDVIQASTTTDPGIPLQPLQHTQPSGASTRSSHVRPATPEQGNAAVESPRTETSGTSEVVHDPQNDQSQVYSVPRGMEYPNDPAPAHGESGHVSTHGDEEDVANRDDADYAALWDRRKWHCDQDDCIGCLL